MGLLELTILLGGAIFLVSRLARLGHVWSVIRSFRPAGTAADDVAARTAQLRRKDAPVNLGSDDDADDVGVALALALRDAESSVRRGEVDPA